MKGNGRVLCYTQTLKLGFGLIMRGPKAVYYPLCRLLIELWERPAPGKDIVFGLLIMRGWGPGGPLRRELRLPSPRDGGKRNLSLLRRVDPLPGVWGVVWVWCAHYAPRLGGPLWAR